MSKRDRQATELAEFSDPRSFVGKRKHPGTDHPCIYLRGDDVGVLRQRIYERDAHRCTLKLACDGTRELPYDGTIWERWHLEHEQGGLGLDRCWCDENVRGACAACHFVKDGRVPRFGER